MISENLQRLQESNERISLNIANAYNKCEEKGATLPIVQNSDNLASTIESIEQGSSGWQPQEDWWDIDSILENDTEDYPAKMILLFNNSFDKFDIYRCNASKVKTSDGVEYTGDDIYFSHTWDTTKDKQCSLGYKTRYVIYYFDQTGTIFVNDIVNMNKGILYAICKNFILNNYNNGGFYRNRTIQAIKFINSGTFNSYGFKSTSLRKIILQNTVLQAINIQENRLYETDLTEFDFSESDDLSYFYQSLESLTYVGTIDTSNVKGFTGAFRYCYYLNTIESLDFSSATAVTNMFSQCYALTNINQISNIKISGIDLKDCELMNYETLIRFIDALHDYSDDTSGAIHSITFGTTNLAKLTDEDKARIVLKGWTVA